MWETIFQMASNTGIWSFLFVSLFFIQLKDSKTREEKYQLTIASLAENLRVVTLIKDDVVEIKKTIDDFANKKEIE